MAPMSRVFDFNLRHLEAVVAIGRCGSISAASAEVNLSQPALTQALAKLEAQLGRKLFDRQPSGVTRTEAGEYFLARAGWAVEEIAEAARNLRRTARLRPLAFPERLISMVQLRALLSVAKAGSYALGARQIGLSQPSTRRAVKELELVLGVPLVVRVGRAMRPTSAAERLVRSVRLAFAELEAGLDELLALDQVGAGRISLGTLPLARAALLPRAFAEFAKAHPWATMTVIEAGYGDLVGELRAGGIDFLVGALRDPPPPPDLVQEPLFVDDLYIVARAGHPLAGPGKPTSSDLARFPWVVGAQGAPMRRTWEALFAGGERPATQIESASILLARGLLLDGDWLALMSFDQFCIEERAGLLARVGPLISGSGRQIGVTLRADWRPTATQELFLGALRGAACERPARK